MEPNFYKQCIYHFRKTTKLEKPKPTNSRNNSGGRHWISSSSNVNGDTDENKETASAEPYQKEKLVIEEKRLKEA